MKFDIQVTLFLFLQPEIFHQNLYTKFRVIDILILQFEIKNHAFVFEIITSIIHIFRRILNTIYFCIQRGLKLPFTIF